MKHHPAARRERPSQGDEMTSEKKKTAKAPAPKASGAAKKTAGAAKGKKSLAAKAESKPQPSAPPAPEPAPKPSPVGAEVPLVGLEDVAKMLRVSALQVRQMVQSGRIPGVKVDGQWRFNKDLVFEAFHRRSRGF
jgi:excisionase family DNA binding protein